MTSDALPATVAVCADAVAAGRTLGAYLFVWRRGEVVADLALGEAEPGVAAAPGDVGELRCAVKPLTTLCVARAMEAGLLSLDDTIARWAPAGAARRITGLSLRQLLTHSSGMPSHLGPEVYAVDFREYVTGLLTAEVPAPMWHAQPIYNLAQAWHLLAWVVQEVYGRPFQDIVAESVVRPLGLSSLSLLDEASLSRPYQRRTVDGGYQPIRPADPDVFATRPNPSFGGFATAADLGRLYVHLMRCLTEGGVVGPETMRTLVRPQGTVRFSPGGTPFPFGHGFFLGGEAMRFGAEWGTDGFGHMGSIHRHYAALAFCVPRLQTVIAMRLSSVGIANNRLFTAIAEALHRDLTPSCQRQFN